MIRIKKKSRDAMMMLTTQDARRFCMDFPRASDDFSHQKWDARTDWIDLLYVRTHWL
jgi:hypothetical protein